MDISVVNCSEDEMAEKLLQFYETLASEEKEPTSGPDLPFEPSHTSRNVLKVSKKNVKLNKTIEKIRQKEKDKKKVLKQKKKRLKAKHEENMEEELASHPVHDEPNYMESESDVPSSSVSLSKYVDLLNEGDDISYFENKCYLCCKPEENGSLLVALFPNTQLYLVGNYKLKLLLGNISVLGYTFKENEEHVVYAPPTHSIISINVQEGYQIKQMEKERLLDRKISYDWVQDLNISKNDYVVIARISRYNSNLTQILDETKIVTKEKMFDVCLWRETLGVEIIEDFENCKFRLQNESEDWIQYMDDIRPYVLSNNLNIFVICGGKGVGKSTFLKYAINTFMSKFGFDSVACIDLDPGQPEFSLPGCLTLTVCNAPLLGPSFSHRENTKFSYQKQILLGDVSVQEVVRIYLDIVSHLVWKFKRDFSDLPLIINTMGFTATMGFDIMIDIIRMTEPTHVISIEGYDSKLNYPTSLDSDIVSKINRGILRYSGKRLTYRHDIFKTVAVVNKMMASKLSREVNIMAYLSMLWKPNETHFTCHTLNEAQKLDWTNVAIYVFGSPFQPHVLLAVNSSLVALCRVKEEFLHRPQGNRPLQIQYNSPWIVSCKCIGWGVVSGTDPVTREIFIYTPLSQKLFKQVNLIAMPNVQLPPRMRTLFPLNDTSYMRKKKEEKKRTRKENL